MTPKLIKEACEKHTEQCKKNNINPIMQELEKINKNLQEFKIQIIREMSDMPNQLERRFDNRYADKHTEQSVDGIRANINKLLWLVVGAVIIGVLNLVII